MLFYSLLIAVISVTIPNEIGYIAPLVDLKRDKQITIFKNYYSRTIVAIPQRGPHVTINYTSPAGSSNTQIFDGSAILLLDGDCEFSINIPKGETVTIAYATLSRMSCDTVKVYTTPDMTYNFTHSSQNADSCLLYAPGSRESRFRIESTNLGDDILFVYNHIMGNAWYDRYTEDEAAGWSTTSTRPWLFRFESGPVHRDDHYITINAETTKAMPEGAVMFTGEPKREKKAPRGVLKHNYIVPIIGSAAPFFLVVCWMYAAVSLAKKAPAKPPSFNSNDV